MKHHASQLRANLAIVGSGLFRVGKAKKDDRIRATAASITGDPVAVN